MDPTRSNNSQGFSANFDNINFTDNKDDFQDYTNVEKDKVNHEVNSSVDKMSKEDENIVATENVEDFYTKIGNLLVIKYDDTPTQDNHRSPKENIHSNKKKILNNSNYHSDRTPNIHGYPNQENKQDDTTHKTRTKSIKQVKDSSIPPSIYPNPHPTSISSPNYNFSENVTSSNDLGLHINKQDAINNRSKIQSKYKNSSFHSQPTNHYDTIDKTPTIHNDNVSVDDLNITANTPNSHLHSTGKVHDSSIPPSKLPNIQVGIPTISSYSNGNIVDNNFIRNSQSNPRQEHDFSFQDNRMNLNSTNNIINQNISPVYKNNHLKCNSIGEDDLNIIRTNNNVNNKSINAGVTISSPIIDFDNKKLYIIDNVIYESPKVLEKHKNNISISQLFYLIEAMKKKQIEINLPNYNPIFKKKDENKLMIGTCANKKCSGIKTVQYINKELHFKTKFANWQKNMQGIYDILSKIVSSITPIENCTIADEICTLNYCFCQNSTNDCRSTCICKNYNVPKPCQTQLGKRNRDSSKNTNPLKQKREYYSILELNFKETENYYDFENEILNIMGYNCNDVYILQHLSYTKLRRSIRNEFNHPLRNICSPACIGKYSKYIISTLNFLYAFPSSYCYFDRDILAIYLREGNIYICHRDSIKVIPNTTNQLLSSDPVRQYEFLKQQNPNFIDIKFYNEYLFVANKGIQNQIYYSELTSNINAKPLNLPGGDMVGFTIFDNELIIAYPKLLRVYEIIENNKLLSLKEKNQFSIQNRQFLKITNTNENIYILLSNRRQNTYNISNNQNNDNNDSKYNNQNSGNNNSSDSSNNSNSNNSNSSNSSQNTNLFQNFYGKSNAYIMFTCVFYVMSHPLGLISQYFINIQKCINFIVNYISNKKYDDSFLKSKQKRHIDILSTLTSTKYQNDIAREMIYHKKKPIYGTIQWYNKEDYSINSPDNIDENKYKLGVCTAKPSVICNHKKQYIDNNINSCFISIFGKCYVQVYLSMIKEHQNSNQNLFVYLDPNEQNGIGSILTQNEYLYEFDNRNKIIGRIYNMDKYANTTFPSEVKKDDIVYIIVELFPLSYKEISLYMNDYMNNIPIPLGIYSPQDFLYNENNLIDNNNIILANQETDIFHINEISILNNNFKKLNLSSNSLSGSFKNRFSNFPDLTELDISDNNISGDLPQSIGDLSSIKYIYLSKNNISGIPESIGKLKNLKYLVLDNNKIQYLPDSINNLKQLEDLNISNNNIKKIPSLSSLENLYYLNIENNSISELPQSFNSLTQLIELNISRNKFKKLPECIQNLINLQEFNASFCNITQELDNKIFTMLKNLQVVNLSHNKFYGTLPNSLFTLNTLEYIYLFNNQFSGYLPNVFPKSLLQFDISNNTIEGDIPSSLALYNNIEMIDLRNNRFNNKLDSDFYYFPIQKTANNDKENKSFIDFFNNIQLSDFNDISYIQQDSNTDLVMKSTITINNKHITVILKMINSTCNENNKCTEYDILSSHLHPNIDGILGSFKAIPTQDMISHIDNTIEKESDDIKPKQFYVLEYHKYSLASVVDNLTEKQILKYACSLAKVLVYLYENKVINFNINADNIMISNNDIILTDFTKTGYINDDFTTDNKYLLQVNEHYLSPEVINARNINDNNIQCKNQYTWILSILVYYMLSKGNYPYNMTTINTKEELPKCDFNNIPSTFHKTLESCLCEQDKRVPLQYIWIQLENKFRTMQS